MCGPRSIGKHTKHRRPLSQAVHQFNIVTGLIEALMPGELLVQLCNFSVRHFFIMRPIMNVGKKVLHRDIEIMLGFRNLQGITQTLDIRNQAVRLVEIRRYARFPATDRSSEVSCLNPHRSQRRPDQVDRRHSCLGFLFSVYEICMRHFFRPLKVGKCLPSLPTVQGPYRSDFKTDEKMIFI